MKKLLFIITFFACCFSCLCSNAQDKKRQLAKSSALDTSQVKHGDTTITITVDTAAMRKHDPKKATMRALMFPGLGQIYNRQYWKLPLAYAAVGIPAGFFFYNNAWYKKTRLAYQIVQSGATDRYGEIDAALFTKDQTTGKLVPLDAESLQYYRNSFRQNRDYSVLYFLLGYALTIVDATVSGHLKEFDVSEDLSMRIEPAFDVTTRTPGISMAFNFKTPTQKKWTVR